MARPRGRSKTARLTVNLEPQEHAALIVLARQEDVPLAWIVRRAVTDLIAALPLDETQSEIPKARRLFLTPKVGR